MAHRISAAPALPDTPTHGAGMVVGALAGLSFFLFGAGPILWTISSTTLRQTVTPQALLGRVSAMFLTVNMGARPLVAATCGGRGSARV